MEKWKEIEGYTDYMVSNLGNVKSLGNDKTRKEKILTKQKTTKGYLMVSLSKNGKQKIFKIHRLVAQAFIPNPNNLPQVNHKDENKTNNCVENLEWCSAEYNTNYGTRNERVSKSILQFSLNGEFIRKWNSITEARKELNIGKHISSCCNGKRTKAGGFIWGYESDYERIHFNVFDLEIYKKKVA